MADGLIPRPGLGRNRGGGGRPVQVDKAEATRIEERIRAPEPYPT
ncbi:hypothetical protein Y590_03070 [Methylobacterium sp. AMS5]|nr:hypothetical protein Y590_03070 [Methylobacterium sp. AMS5]